MLSVSDRFRLKYSPCGCETTGSLLILLALFVRRLDHWLGCLGATGSVARGVSDRFRLKYSPCGCETTGSLLILLAFVRRLDLWLGCLGATLLS